MPALGLRGYGSLGRADRGRQNIEFGMNGIRPPHQLLNHQLLRFAVAAHRHLGKPEDWCKIVPNRMDRVSCSAHFGYNLSAFPVPRFRSEFLTPEEGFYAGASALAIREIA